MSIREVREYVGFVDPWDGSMQLLDDEVVRCRDCKHAQWMDEDGMWGFSGLAHEWPQIYPDTFCAWGEREDG